MDTAVAILGLAPATTSREDVRLCALAVRHLGLATPAKTQSATDDSTLLRRCGLLGVRGFTFQAIEDLLAEAGKQRGPAAFHDMSMLSILYPELAPFEKLLGVPDLLANWLLPMKEFCSTHGAALPEERAQVHELLCRCGWADQPDALQVVLDELQWNSLAALHFALGLLRRPHSTLWLWLTEVLQIKFGAAAVLPLRKLADPELMLALIVAAPDEQPVSVNRAKYEEEKKKRKEEEEEEEERKKERRR